MFFPQIASAPAQKSKLMLGSHLGRMAIVLSIELTL